MSLTIESHGNWGKSKLKGEPSSIIWYEDLLGPSPPIAPVSHAKGESCPHDLRNGAV